MLIVRHQVGVNAGTRAALAPLPERSKPLAGFGKSVVAEEINFLVRR